VVEGPLAFQMRRFTATQAIDCGLQILNLPQVAASLAGGFAAPASADQVEPAIQEALDEGGFDELERMRHLPGRPKEDCIVLLSGGLDSFIGAIDIVANGHRPFAVSQSVRVMMRSRMTSPLSSEEV
jgi:hypothetical protein